MSTLDEFTHEPRIAYFSMEIALQNNIPTYSGGLGVLAGDTMRSATDLALPVVAVTLVSRAGYFQQQLDTEGKQTEKPMQWQPSDHAELLNAKIAITIEHHTVWVSAWLYILQGHMNGRQPIILLDTDVAENSTEDRKITDTLYGGDRAYRLKQEIVLGVGGIRLLQALGFEIRKYHMNEGHSALLGLELLRRYKYSSADLRPGDSPYNIPRVRELCCFTTHTPVAAGHDRFDYDLVQRVLGEVVDMTTLKHLAGKESLNMTCLALNLSEHVNGVTKRHAEVSRKMFPGYRVKAITNGVHPYTWTSPSFAKLYDHHLPGWCHEPELLVRADCCIPDEAMLEAHQCAKVSLIEKIQALTGVEFNKELLTLGFARRMTAYKRPDLIFSNMERLKKIARNQPFQIVLAGKAHPNDEGGKQLIETLHHHIRELDGIINMVFLPGYDVDIGQLMVAGVDVWLNTPQRPMEASGTSGMKAAFNGVPNLSVLDGWWIEGCIEGVTGWAVGNSAVSIDIESENDDDARALYDKLEKVVLPLYQDQTRWVKVMKGAICKNASFFNSHRMMRRYTTEAYIR